MTRAAILGGRGFIGGHLARWLEPRLGGAPGGAVLACEQEGLADDARLLRGFAPNALVWAAGSRVAPDAELDEMHVRAPLANLEACRATVRRLVYLSSAEVYGPAAVPFRETQPPDPRSPYARAKVRGEAALAERTAALGVALVVLRPAVVYGPRQGGPAFIPQVLGALSRGERFPMTGGEQTRDLLFVEDLTAAVERALAPDAPPGVYNAGSGRETGLSDLARLCARLVGPGAEALLDVGALPYRADEQMRYVLDPARAREVLGWTATTRLEDGLRATLDAMRAGVVPAPAARGAGGASAPSS